MERVAGGNSFSLVDANLLKAMGTTYAQNALEFATYEVAAAATMGSYSPIFSEHSVKDIVANAAWGGGIVGGGILGSISAVQTYGAVKRARDAVDRSLNPMRFVKDSPEGVDPWVDILNWKSQIAPPPTNLTEAQLKAWNSRNDKLDVDILERLVGLSGGDAEIAKAIHASLKGMDQDKAWAAIHQLAEVTRAGAINKVDVAYEAKRAAQEIIAAGGKVKPSVEKAAAYDGANKWLILEGGSFAVTHTEPTSLKLVDRLDSVDVQAKLRQARAQIKTSDDFNLPNATPEQVELRYLVAFERKIKDGDAFNPTDLPFLEAALASEAKSVVVGNVRMDKQQLAAHVKGLKEDFGAKLLTYEATDPGLTTQIIARMINVDYRFLEGGGHSTF
jgi:hypothetical protein